MEESSSLAAVTPSRAEEPDSRNSLRHILAAEPMDGPKPPSSQADTSPQDEAEATIDAPDANKAAGEGEAAKPSYTATTTTTRRNANGSVSSVYSGNKIKHLKKDDGIPLWRKDIQYDFLKLVFENDKGVFTKPADGTKGHTFADIYLDAMARSSKCSKILKDKLLSERQPAVNMAMVCLLVNVGRMNTTLNFFPEMRAQLRTYHSIPSLQAHQDPNAYKQLQDAPRLKSILKGATEDEEQPGTIEDIRAATIPRTNPVNLIFVLSQYAPKISELHFLPPRDFFDLVMRSNLSSRSRATAFLWLMWWYLESDFTKETAESNPFGAGQLGPSDDPTTNEFPIKCPPFDILTPEQEAMENVDTPDEKEFGEGKRKERAVILQSDMAPVVTGPKRSNKKAFSQNPVFSVLADDGSSTPGRDRQSPSHGSTRGRKQLAKSLIERDYPSDTDRTHSLSPPASITTSKKTPNMRINTLLNDDGPSSTPAKGPGRGNWSRAGRNLTHGRNFKSKLDAAMASESGAQSPGALGPSFNGPHGFYLPLNGSDPSHKRTRPLTQHQLAVEHYRRRRVDVILDRALRSEFHRAARRRRERNGFMQSWLRCKGMSEGYDTDEESHVGAVEGEDGAAKGIGAAGNGMPPPVPAGLAPLDWAGETNDHGEESYHRAKMISRALRRLERWEGGARGVRMSAGENTSRSKMNGAGGRVGDVDGEGDEGDGMLDEDDEDDENGDGDDDEDMMDVDDKEESESEEEDEVWEHEREREMARV